MQALTTLSADEFDQIKRNIHDIRIALLTTQLADGSLRARPMATHQLDSDGTMWFFTHDDSAKVDQIRQHSAISLGFSDPQGQKTVTTSGHAEVVKDQAKIDELWTDDLLDWFPEGKDNPNLVLLKVTTLAGECWE